MDVERCERFEAHEEPQHVSTGRIVTTVVEGREGKVSHFATHSLLFHIAPLELRVAHVKRLSVTTSITALGKVWEAAKL